MIFKYWRKPSKILNCSIFTFQSGDIQIRLIFIFSFPSLFIYIPIWWYSNILYRQESPKYFAYLHSNLVIFKSYVSRYIFPILTYLHSNLVIFKYIQHKPMNLKVYNLHSNLVIFKSISFPKSDISIKKFTFQSGDIQIDIKSKIWFYAIYIYIPIWWYSNFVIFFKVFFDFFYLHSNLVIFKSGRFLI